MLRGATAAAARSRLGRALLAAVLVLALAGCEVRAELNVSVDDDGSGNLELAVGLDEDALSRRPGVLDDLDLSDLADAGWELTGPAREADGFTWIRARRRFSTPGELGTLVDGVGGEQGPFRDFGLRREDALTERRYRFEGTVDFTAGAGGFTRDPEVAEALDADQVEALEERLGAAIDDMVQVQVAVRLPGSVDSNARTQASNGAVWQPSVVDREAAELRATGTVDRTGRLVGLGLGAAVAFALVLFLLVRVASRRRPHRSPDHR